MRRGNRHAGQYSVCQKYSSSQKFCRKEIALLDEPAVAPISQSDSTIENRYNGLFTTRHPGESRGPGAFLDSGFRRNDGELWTPRFPAETANSLGGLSGKTRDSRGRNFPRERCGSLRSPHPTIRARAYAWAGRARRLRSWPPTSFGPGFRPVIVVAKSAVRMEKHCWTKPAVAPGGESGISFSNG